MIVHTIRAANAAKGIDRTIVSTDDVQIAEVARNAGAEVPFLRPAELAQDATPTLPVIDHAVRTLEAAGAVIDVVVTLQPTSPLRTATQIDAALDLLRSSGASSVVAVAALGYPATIIAPLQDGRVRLHPRPGGADGRRQTAPPAVRITGSIYVTRRSVLESGTLLSDEPAALLTEGPTAIDVDEMADLRAVRRAAARALRP